MDIFTIIFFIFFSAVAVSYGWGMRGTIIGGEKGAMLPGALLGIIIALFSGSEVLASSPWILAGVGALGMYCGGNMTYADTLHLTMHEKNPPHFLKNMLGGLFLRGGIWFGICGGFISMFLSAVSDSYELWQIITFFALLPVFALAFYYLFNKPYDKEKNIFPKIYFSIKRKETWGGLLGILIEILLFTIFFRDWSSLAMTMGSFISGAVGWYIAQLMQIRAKHPAKNGKRFLEKLSRKNAVDAWKIMECVFGFIGGGGSALTFILTKPLLLEKLSKIDSYGYHSVISESKITYILFIIYLIIIAFDLIQFFVIPSDSNRYKKYMKICNNTEFAVYSIIPFTFIMLGSYKVASFIAFSVVLLVLVQEFAEKFNKTGHTKPVGKIPLFIPVIVVSIIAITKEVLLNLTSAMFIYTAVYECAFYGMKKLETGSSRLSPSEKTVHAYFITCCVLIMIITILIQGELICLKT